MVTALGQAAPVTSTSGLPALVPLAMIVVGALLMAVGVTLYLRRVLRYSRWVPAQGVVTGHQDLSGVRLPVVRFTTAEGSQVTATAATPADVATPGRDGAVRLRYDPARPERFTQQGLVVDRTALTALAVDAVGVLLLAAGLVLR
ncbi:DUF3592 domain-containing protein [Geodermatophilaceae bacterium NBWT11]|nr:DUF3592 domain-containing protein [Geodermatophilaceae bacterium NBWT11]